MGKQGESGMEWRGSAWRVRTQSRLLVDQRVEFQAIGLEQVVDEHLKFLISDGDSECNLPRDEVGVGFAISKVLTAHGIDGMA